MKNPKLTITSEEFSKLNEAKKVLKELFSTLDDNGLNDAHDVTLDIYTPDKSDYYKEEFCAQIEIKDFDLVYETLAGITGWN